MLVGDDVLAVGVSVGIVHPPAYPMRKISYHSLSEEPGVGAIGVVVGVNGPRDMGTLVGDNMPDTGTPVYLVCAQVVLVLVSGLVVGPCDIIRCRVDPGVGCEDKVSRCISAGPDDAVFVNIPLLFPLGRVLEGEGLRAGPGVIKLNRL